MGRCGSMNPKNNTAQNMNPRIYRKTRLSLRSLPITGRAVPYGSDRHVLGVLHLHSTQQPKDPVLISRVGAAWEPQDSHAPAASFPLSLSWPIRAIAQRIAISGRSLCLISHSPSRAFARVREGGTAGRSEPSVGF